jgi:hypothetical protein
MCDNKLVANNSHSLKMSSNLRQRACRIGSLSARSRSTGSRVISNQSSPPRFRLSIVGRSLSSLRPTWLAHEGF